MPLVRFEVRNEYALGAPEVYREAAKDDPKDILQGVAVAGLVGLLRQLGDLAEFAAEVFHGLQEEVTITSSRSHKLIARAQRIEAALSPLEKALLAQRSHLHFAYTAGSDWHTRIRCGRNHFVYGDVPQFIMDSYEDCRDPPCLHLLDRFDPAGPGSCLKRYSDPTFFKRASVASGEASNHKIPKDKKRQKIKKRRSWQRNGQASRGASFSYNSDRTQFSQLNIGEHTPSQASTYDAVPRSDFGEQSNLDLRNNSGYFEFDSRPSYSGQPEERESRESISSPVKRNSDYLDYDFLREKSTDAHDDIQINLSQEQSYSVQREEQEFEELISSPVKRCDDSLDYSFLETKNQDAFDDIQINLSQDQAGSKLSSVTWEEKRETPDPISQDSDNDVMRQEDKGDRRLESFSLNLEPETLGEEILNFETVDKLGVQPCDEAVQTKESGDVQLDDIESETDNFMDALNTIESEFETDADGSKRQGGEPYVMSEDRGAQIGLQEHMRHNLACQSSNPESNIMSNCSLVNSSHDRNFMPMSPESSHATSSSINAVAPKDELYPVSKADKDLLSSPRDGDSSNSSNQQTVGSAKIGSIDAGNNVESLSSNVSSNFGGGTSGIPVINGTQSGPESRKLATESYVTPVTFWTNGGLLGLQPSKPPDFSVSNALPQDPVYKKDGEISSSVQHQTENIKNNMVGHDTDSTEYPESGPSFRKIAWKISPADLDIKLGKLGSSLYQNNANSIGQSVTSGNLPPASGADRQSQEKSKESSRISELSSRLLSTSSNKKLLPGDDNCYIGGDQNANAFEQKYGRSFAQGTVSGKSKNLFGGKTHSLSPSSSPPLNHMKISFQPIRGFETSKLKLKFPDGNTNSESSVDIFPSFQLVPEVSIALRNAGSDSDADTFCRSSPSISDDCHSNHSDSDSEQWESSESPTSKDHDMYAALRRMSLTESVSSVPENGTANHNIPDNGGVQFPFVENGVRNSESFRSIDRQSLGTRNHSFIKELPNEGDLVEPQFVPSPAPPPLPPVQWRGMVSHTDSIEDKCAAMPEGSYYGYDIKLSASSISQPKPAPFNEDRIDIADMQKFKRSISLKSNGQREANQGRRTDEKEDFLHQIRTKSFNLRPTMTAKSTLPSGGSATGQVTAILEKANAIRQAVGSDGEDDGNWSDT